MNDLREIKYRIYHEGRIAEVLEKLGCGRVKVEQRGNLFTSSLPDGDNPRSVQIKNTEKLTTYVRSKGVSGDIFSLVSFINSNLVTESELQSDLGNAKMWLVENLGYNDILTGSYRSKVEEKSEVNGWLKDIKKRRKKGKVELAEVEPNFPLDESIKEQYIMLPHVSWIEEGISYKTQMKFEVGFDRYSQRIVVMMHDKDGNLIGVKGRTTTNDERKYLFLYNYNKSIELFNLHRALPYILERKEVFVFEGYKSVMKADQFGYHNSVSIEGDKISDYQYQILKDLGIDINIVIAYDKDKSEKEVTDMAQPLTNRNVYALIDIDNLLEEKDSPTDKGKEVFDNLYRQKVHIPVDKTIFV